MSELDAILDALQELLRNSDTPDSVITAVKDRMAKYSTLRDMPVDRVRWIPLEQVAANDYNPNSVARDELKLLQLSILNDGYTQPVVTFYDSESDTYVIVDGFHRYFCCKSNPEIRARTGGRVPVVVIDKSMADRMASTVRHNRARGKHSVEGMSDLVFKMLEQGSSDSEICNQLGMEVEELLKLKHLTGFSKLFKNIEYGSSWEGEAQVKTRLAHEKKLREGV